MTKHINWSRAERGTRVEVDDILPTVLQDETLPCIWESKWVSTSGHPPYFLFPLSAGSNFLFVPLYAHIHHKWAQCPPTGHWNCFCFARSQMTSNYQTLCTLHCVYFWPFWNMYFGTHSLEILSSCDLHDIPPLWFSDSCFLSLLCQVLILHLTLKYVPRSTTIGSFLLQVFLAKFTSVHLPQHSPLPPSNPWAPYSTSAGNGPWMPCILKDHVLQCSHGGDWSSEISPKVRSHRTWTREFSSDSKSQELPERSSSFSSAGEESLHNSCRAELGNRHEQWSLAFLIFLFSKREALQTLFYFFSTTRFWVLMGQKEHLLDRVLSDEKLQLAMISIRHTQRPRTLRCTSNLMEFGGYPPYGRADSALWMIRSMFMEVQNIEPSSSSSMVTVSSFELGTWLPRMETVASTFPLQEVVIWLGQWDTKQKCSWSSFWESFWWDKTSVSFALFFFPFSNLLPGTQMPPSMTK